jgi:probable HAF family extracellular repeat protein
MRLVSSPLSTIASLALSALVLAPGPGARAESLPRYAIQEVPTLSGGAVNFALDINNRGQVSGNSRKAGTGSQLFPYVWTIGQAQPVEIGILPGVPTFGRGFAVNDHGVVVGESGNGPSKAFRFEDGSLADLGALPGGSGGVANDINNAGRVVGAASNGQAVRAFYTDGGGSLIDLGTPLGTTNSFARAYAINDTGTIAGVARNASDTASEATLWTFDANGMPVASTIGSPVSGVFSEALGLNDLGHAVGRYSDPTSNRTRAFFYDGSASVDLGLLDDEPTFTHARAIDINESGLIVGHVARFDNAPSFGGAAVLWRDGRIFDLNDLIDPSIGWRLLSAEGINDRGQIVGFGTFDGQTRAFVLTVIPEPSSAILAAIGVVSIVALGIARRRRASTSRRGIRP